MTVYSKLLAQGFVTSGDDVAVYTAPATGTVVVRDIILGQADSTGGLARVTCLSGSLFTPIYGVVLSGTGTTQHNDLRTVLQPGDVLHVQTLGGDIWYRISGYLLGG